MCNLVQDLHLTQLVNEPTRGNHILDLVLASTPDFASNVQTVGSLPGSDHHAVQFDLAKFKRATFDDFQQGNYLHACLIQVASDPKISLAIRVTTL